MSYPFRSKKRVIGGPAGDAGNKQIKKNRIADKSSVPPPDQSNSSKEYKTDVTQQSEMISSSSKISISTELGNENLKPDKLSMPPPDQSNSSKEDKTNNTNLSELKTMVIKTPISTELGNINHNIDVFTQNIQEKLEKFNNDTILPFDICHKLENNESKNEYRIICKIGYGGFSIVWLVIDMKSKEFKVAKLFKYDHGISKTEREILQKTANHPNILRYFETIYFQYRGRNACVAIYEPLGKDLHMLMKEASKYGGGLSITVVKKIAKHILMALKTLHELKVIHSDIKLHNIATCVSQLSLRREFEKVVELMKSGQSISSLRMVCQKDAEIDMNEKTKLFEEELEKVSKLEISDVTELIFKLIDFGNAMKEGTESRTGTYGYRPPEYFFGSPLLPSHDIWSLGVTIVVLLTNKTFIKSGNGSKIGEITALRNMFGKFPRCYFKDFKDLDGYKTKFSTRSYSPAIAVNRIEKFLRTKFDKLPMDGDDRINLVDFLFHMLNTVPNQRLSASELLLHPWLNDGCECDGEIDSTQKSSDSFKTQERQETPISENGTSHAYVAVPLPSNSKNTSETSLDNQSIDEQIEKLALADTKHSKNGGQATEKTKKETKKALRYDSFIYKENDGKHNLYHKYWRIPYRGDNLFHCPKCRQNIHIELKVGFVMVSDKSWHKKGCVVCNITAPQKGQSFFVRSYSEDQKEYKLIKELITKEEIDRKRKSLEDQGYKPIVDEVSPDVFCQKEVEINEDNNNNNGTSSVKSDATQDTDLDETEEDTNKTISEFSSGESYIENDASYAPSMESFSDEEIWNLVD